MKKRILLADDDEGILELNSIFIESLTGVKPEIVTCSNGQKAIDALRAAAAKKFDMVITDFEMGSGPDGVDVVNEAVRLNIANAHRPNVFVSTCYDFRDDTPVSKRLRAAGKLPGVKVMDKLGIEDLERHIVPLLVNPA